jgi:hypothetical protein
MLLNVFLFVSKEKKTIGIVILLFKLLITTILSLIFWLSVFGALSLSQEKSIDGKVESNEILVFCWPNVFQIILIFPPN